MNEFLPCPRRAALLEAVQIAALAEGLTTLEKQWLIGEGPYGAWVWEVGGDLAVKGLCDKRNGSLIINRTGEQVRAHLEGQEK